MCAIGAFGQRMTNEHDILCQAVKQAGREVLKQSREGFHTYRKADGSPVTSADLAANEILHHALTTAFPDDAWMSEESPETPERLSRSRVWIVDPIDGTKHFIQGTPEYSISVALVDNAQPVLGVVYNPATEELFSAMRGHGARLNGQLIPATDRTDGRLSILINPARVDSDTLQPFARNAHLRPMGSIAYSLALVAAGQADGVINFDRLHEWDVVAGWLLVNEAGGTTTDSRGNAMAYNQANPLVHGIFATRHGARQSFETLIATCAAPNTKLPAHPLDGQG